MEEMGHMFLDVIHVEVFHVSKPSQMKQNHDSDHFATTHFRVSHSILLR